MKLLLSLALLSLPCCLSALEANSQIQVQPLLKTTTSWDGQKLHYPSGQAEITGLKITIAEGAETGWHLHPVPSFGMITKGTLEIRLKDGRTKRIQAGDTLAEVVDTAHNGRNVGTGPVELLVFYAGVEGKALTEKLPHTEASQH
jgi:quercetin dioxygenase-like cupin family protein